MSTRGHTPRLRDAVDLDGRSYRVTWENRAPMPGFWLGRPDGHLVLERFIPRSSWSLRWNAGAQRWEGT